MAVPDASQSKTYSPSSLGYAITLLLDKALFNVSKAPIATPSFQNWELSSRSPLRKRMSVICICWLLAATKPSSKQAPDRRFPVKVGLKFAFAALTSPEQKSCYRDKSRIFTTKAPNDTLLGVGILFGPISSIRLGVQFPVG